MTIPSEERKPDRRFAYANPTLVQRRQADADLQPTITTFYRRWFERLCSRLFTNVGLPLTKRRSALGYLPTLGLNI
jgi:hypothetical protein